MLALCSATSARAWRGARPSRREDKTRRVGASLDVIFGRVSVELHVYPRRDPAEDARVHKLAGTLDDHTYPTALLDDLGDDAVPLLQSYLQSGGPSASPAGKAQFLLSLLCARLGPPDVGEFGRLFGQSRSFAEEKRLARVGELAAELQFTAADMSALLDAFGGDSGLDTIDFANTSPQPLLAAHRASKSA